MVASYDHGNESSDSIKYESLIDQVSNSHILKSDLLHEVSPMQSSYQFI